MEKVAGTPIPVYHYPIQPHPEWCDCNECIEEEEMAEVETVWSWNRGPLSLYIDRVVAIPNDRTYGLEFSWKGFQLGMMWSR